MINKKQECDLISDLLPLYLETKISRETGDFIREHLAECPECRKNLEFMNSSYEEMLGEHADTAQEKGKKKFTKNILFGKAKGKIFVCGYLLFLACVWVYIIACFY